MSFKIKLPKWLIRIVGHIYISKRPLWISYKPELHKVKGNEIRQILDLVKPGDILLRRYDGYLNTYFTPGFWSHAAICVDNNNIIHSVGEGVIKEDIINFCRCDSVTIIRIKPEYITKEDIDIAIERAYRMVNNKVQYDYDFMDNNGKVYCTELLNQCFSSLFNDDFVKYMGRNLILPDPMFNSKKVDKVIEFKY